MSSKIIERILQEVDCPELMETLSHRLQGADLHSLLLEVFQERTNSQTPTELYRSYQENRYVKPSPLSPIDMLAMDQLAFRAAKKFRPIELSPVAPLGNCSAFGKTNQKKIISALRHTEVVADNTNLMVLEAARLRKELLKETPKSPAFVHLCSSHRLVRTQRWDNPAFLPHFRIFGLVTAGKDTGSYHFEQEAFTLHLEALLNMITRLPEIGCEVKNIKVGITPLQEFPFLDQMIETLIPKLSIKHPQFRIIFDRHRENGLNYYQNFCFSVEGDTPSGETINLADGGTTDWTQQLLQSRKERCLISGIGTERMCSLFKVGNDGA